MQFGGTGGFASRSRIVGLLPRAAKASKPVYGRENRFRPGAHAEIIRHVYPADRARRINEKFGGPRNVLTLFASMGMQHSVQPDRLGLGV